MTETITIKGMFTQRSEYAFRLADGSIMENIGLNLFEPTLRQAEVAASHPLVQKQIPGVRLATRAILIGEWIDVPDGP